MTASKRYQDRFPILGCVAWAIVAAVGLRLGSAMAVPGIEAIYGLSQGQASFLALAGFAAGLAVIPRAGD